MYIVDPNTQNLNVNAHDPHLPYPTKLVSYASYGSKRHSCVTLVGEGTGTVMAGRWLVPACKVPAMSPGYDKSISSK